MTGLRLVLASESPRRASLLDGVGLEVERVPSGLDEKFVEGEAPEDMVARLASAKGRHVALSLGREAGSAVVLAADTAVVLDGTVLGKPSNPASAGSMLRMLSGRTHRVLTGVFVMRTDDARSAAATEVTRVTFRTLDAATVRWYLGTGEPMDKAGAYGIQGFGAFLTRSIEGSWSNVVGLPLERLPALFAEVGLDLLGCSRSDSGAVTPR